MQTFFEKFLAGKAGREDFFNAVKEWHVQSRSGDMYAYLGMTEEDYKIFIRHPERLEQLKRKYAATGAVRGRSFLEKLKAKFT